VFIGYDLIIVEFIRLSMCFFKLILFFINFSILGDVPVEATLDKILILIKQKGFADTEFCTIAGLHKNAVAEWKAGTTQSYNKHLPKIAEVLGVDVEVLTGEDINKLPVAPTLTDRVAALLSQRKMQGKELADALGLSAATVSGWNSGKTNPTLESVVKMAEIFNVSTDFLLLGKASAPAIDAEAEEVVELWAQLDKAGKAIIKGAIYDRLEKQKNGS